MPPNFCGWYAYAHIAAMSRNTEVRQETLGLYETETSKNVFRDIYFSVLRETHCTPQNTLICMVVLTRVVKLKLPESHVLSKSLSFFRFHGVGVVF